MKDTTVNVENILLLTSAVVETQSNSPLVHRAGALYAPPGHGKTVGSLKVMNALGGDLFRCKSLWTPATMARQMLGKWGLPLHHSSFVMFSSIKDYLLQTDKPIFFDEADYMLTNPTLLNPIRDLYDETHACIWFIVTDAANLRSKSMEKLGKRIAKWVEFRPCGLEDTRLLAKEVCEVKVQEDLLKNLKNKAHGVIADLVTGLNDLERFANEKKLNEIDLKQWGNKKFSFE